MLWIIRMIRTDFAREKQTLHHSPSYESAALPGKEKENNKMKIFEKEQRRAALSIATSWSFCTDRAATPPWNPVNVRKLSLRNYHVTLHCKKKNIKSCTLNTATRLWCCSQQSPRQGGSQPLPSTAHLQNAQTTCARNRRRCPTCEFLCHHQHYEMFSLRNNKKQKDLCYLNMFSSSTRRTETGPECWVSLSCSKS